MSDTPTEKVSNGTTEKSEAQKFVPVELATDDELDSFLGSQDASGAEDDDSPSEVEDPEAEEGEAEVSEAEEGTGKEASAESDDDEPVTLTKKELRELQSTAERSEKNEKQVAHQRKFIADRNQEIGNLRKELRETREKLSEGLDDLPQSQAHENAKKIDKIDENLQALDNEEALNNHVIRVHDAVTKHVDFNTFDAQDVAEVLINDGLSQEYVVQFLANPYPQTTEGELVQLYKRASERRLLKKVVNLLKKVRKENLSLKEKPERVMKKVSRLLDAPQKLNGGSSTSTARRKHSERDIELMSDEELDSLLENE